MKKSANQIVFDGVTPETLSHEEVKGDLEAQRGSTTIEFLPCLFQNNVDESNKAIYFDSIVREAEAAHVPKGMSDLAFKQVSLQGRRMIGFENELPGGYRGFVFHRPSGSGHDENGDGGEFTHTTEWRKDQWQAGDDSFAKSIMSYLECSTILNQED